jgi:uncharacterized protein (UPF0335 family)
VCGGLWYALQRRSANGRRCIIERIEHLEDEIKELSEAKKEIYLEAKSNGFDVRIIREVIRLRKHDPKERDELESLIEEYWQAIKQAPPPGQKAAPAENSTIGGMAASRRARRSKQVVNKAGDQ